MFFEFHSGKGDRGHAIRITPLYGDDPDVVDEFAYNILDGIMLYEVGHALIDVYDLPTTGMEEDAVDQFSALIQSRTYGDYDPYFETVQIMMLDMAGWWDYMSQYMEAPYWAVHSLNERRFYNIACYAYGADPEYNRDLLGFDYLPHSRAKTCQHGYERMSSSWDRLLDGYLVEWGRGGYKGAELQGHLRPKALTGEAYLVPPPDRRAAPPPVQARLH